MAACRGGRRMRGGGRARRVCHRGMVKTSLRWRSHWAKTRTATMAGSVASIRRAPSALRALPLLLLPIRCVSSSCAHMTPATLDSAWPFSPRNDAAYRLTAPAPHASVLPLHATKLPSLPASVCYLSSVHANLPSPTLSLSLSLPLTHL